MIKYFILAINSIIFLILNFLDGGKNTITHNIPSSARPGEEVKVTWKINKGDATGFGKFEITLPEGIILAEDGENSGSFAYENQKAKWSWAELPQDSGIVLKTVLKISSSATGKKILNSKFSFADNNEKTGFEMPVFEISLISDSLKKNITSVDSTVKNPNAEPAEKLELERTVMAGPNGELIFDIKIKKLNTKGFARYSDNIVSNMTAKAGKLDGSAFLIADGKVRFIWVNAPNKSNLELSYTLIGPPGSTLNMEGEYSYLEDNQSKSIVLKPEVISIPGTPSKETVATKEPEKRGEEIKTDSITNPTAGNGQLEKKEGNVSFHVQVGAFTNTKVTAEKMKSLFHIKEQINSEMSEGFSKFYLGKNTQYRNARRQRDQIVTDNKVKSAFVIARNLGKRITVQEGLMISNQKWFK